MVPTINFKGNKPERASYGAAGYDLRYSGTEVMYLGSGEYATVPTGTYLELPSVHFVAKVVPRSGLAAKHGVTVLNSPGIIDSDYRGEIHVVLINHGHLAYTVNPGDRIAQLLIEKVVHPCFNLVDELSDTERGVGNFGSTGK